MIPLSAEIVHIVASDTPPARLYALRALAARRDLARAQRVVCAGHALDALDAVVRVDCMPFRMAGGLLAGRSLSRVLGEPGRTVLHVWSVQALRWIEADWHGLSDAEAAPPPRLLLDADATTPRSAISAARGGALESAIHFACPTLVARQRLLEIGVAPRQCAVIRDRVEFGALTSADRAAVRSRLRLAESDLALLVLPPLARDAGSFRAAWAGLLLHHVDRRVVVVACGGGRELRRMSSLAENGRLAHAARFLHADLPIAELLAAADACVFTPERDVDVSGVGWAMAAGKPIVASAVRCTTELLVHGENALLAHPSDPRDTSRRLLEWSDDPQRLWPLAQTARSQAFRLFGARRHAEEYRQAYDNLLNHRPVGEAIADPALTA